jgi:outer membrane protein assembly factor BamB
MATEYILPEKIYQSSIDTSSNLLTLQLRGSTKTNFWTRPLFGKDYERLNNTGNIIVFDLSNKQIRWDRKIDFLRERIFQDGNVIIINHNSSFGYSYSHRLDIKTGADQWESKAFIRYINCKKGIGIGYRAQYLDGVTKPLQGIDLTNGKLVWKTRKRPVYNLNIYLELNDSTIVLVNETGLHAIYLSNGKGWDYKSTTLFTDYTYTFLYDVIWLVGSLAVGHGILTSGNENLNINYHLLSNVLFNNSDIYFASKDEIGRLGHDGQIKWKTPLQDSLISESSIFIRDSLLFMINTGYTHWDIGSRISNTNKIEFGTPFIAA